MWNYRIILHDEEDPPWFALHEVFYDDQGRVKGWTSEPCSFVDDEKEQSILEALNMAVKDITHHSVLKDSDLIR